MEHKQLNIKAPSQFETVCACSCGWERTVWGKLNRKTKADYHRQHVMFFEEEAKRLGKA